MMKECKDVKTGRQLKNVNGQIRRTGKNKDGSGWMVPRFWVRWFYFIHHLMFCSSLLKFDRIGAASIDPMSTLI
jgi:hypothetical protein